MTNLFYRMKNRLLERARETGCFTVLLDLSSPTR
jgi:hypothetical protein